MAAPRASLAAVVLAASALASLCVSPADALGSRVEARAQAAAQVGVEGLYNCPHKCQGVLNQTAYSINANPESFDNTFEFMACSSGCTICEQVLLNNDSPSTCMAVCKNTDWLNPPQEVKDTFETELITKGVVEPDKACIFGCIINLCQFVCQGGAGTGQVEGSGWWGLDGDGCTIKTGKYRALGFYSQAAEYNYWNAQGGQGGQNDCCSNALSLCQYTGTRNLSTNPNYLRVYKQAKGKCKNTVALSGTKEEQVGQICDWFGLGQCGSEVEV